MPCAGKLDSIGAAPKIANPAFRPLKRACRRPTGHGASSDVVVALNAEHDCPSKVEAVKAAATGQPTSTNVAKNVLVSFILLD